MKTSKRGQTTMETAMLLMIVVAAFLSMFLYFKGALQGNYKTNTDAFSPKQYGGRSSDSSDTGIVYTNTVLTLNFENVPDVTYRDLATAPDSTEDAIKKPRGWGVYSR